MCGIGAIITGSEQAARDAVEAFGAALAHRGPDDRGDFIHAIAPDACLGLAHTRLSLIDLSPAGHQPMQDPETGSLIVFNGEIYNHAELAEDLKARGETFKGHSDTEVLLKGLKHFEPEALLRRLRGMFAFAFWDAQSRRLLVARDPFGIKPLYFAAGSGQFSCASEVRGLVRAGAVSGALNKQAVDSFLAFGSVQPPLTIFEGASALLPGHLMWVDEQGNATPPTCYWDWAGVTYDGGIEAIGEALKVAARRNMVADVPVAVLLSGGFDSASLAKLAGDATNQQIITFTMGFPEVPDMSEADLAARIAERLGTDHRPVPILQDDFKACLPAFFCAMDQPSDDGLNAFLISRAVSDAGIKACLHGVGGDELFGGYPSFRQIPMARRVRYLPGPLRRLLAAAIDGQTVARAKIAQLLKTDLSLLNSFLVRRGLFSYEQRRVLLGAEPPCGMAGTDDAWVQFAQNCIAGAKDTFATLSILELMQYAGNKLLADGDVMSMSQGLEMRFPFLDADLVGEVLATPERVKKASGGTHGKPALRDAVEGLPVDLLNKRKQGFTLPLRQWIRDEVARDIAEQPLEDYTRAGLDPTAVKTVFDGFDPARGGQAWLRTWQLFVLGRWLREHRDASVPGGARG